MAKQDTTAGTVGELIRRCSEELQHSEVFFGHGTDNALDESAALVLSVAGIDHLQAIQTPEAIYSRPLTGEVRAEIERLLGRRIHERIPLPYLLKEAWFAGLAFFVDERVLIPRSPFAELIGERFEPWIDSREIRRILEIGTGSGCIAIALAQAFPDSEIVACDLVPEALEVARINITRHALQGRIELVCSDLFAGISGSFDLIVTNPPYVPDSEGDELPPEFGHEPRIALTSGADGLDSARRILQDAARYLTGQGWLALEVGSGAPALEAAFPQLGFIWPEFEYGGEGIALLPATALRGAARSGSVLE